jgi:site-specific recombinase XerC
MNQIVSVRASAPKLPALVATSGKQAARRFLEFFASNIRNRHTRLAYSHAVGLFLTWCEERGVRSLGDVQPLHVAAWIEAQALTASAPIVKLRLAAIRHLFDWLVIGQVVPVNPAASVRGPKHIVREGKTPVLEPVEARALLDSIDVTTPIGQDWILLRLRTTTSERCCQA